MSFVPSFVAAMFTLKQSTDPDGGARDYPSSPRMGLRFADTLVAIIVKLNSIS